MPARLRAEERLFSDPSGSSVEWEPTDEPDDRPDTDSPVRRVGSGVAPDA